MAGKRFRFSLDAVLKLRTYETEQAQQALARALRRVAAAQAEVRAAEERLTALLTRAQTVTRVDGLIRQDQSIGAAVRTRDTRMRQLEQTRSMEASAREALTECVKRENALVRLRETQFAEFQREALHAEQQQLDEQGVIGFMKRQREAAS